MPTTRLRTGLTIRTGKRGITPPQEEYPQYAEQPIQQISQQFTSQVSNIAAVQDMNRKIHLGSQSPRHLRDFWAAIIDTGATISACPMTFCEHIEVMPMGEDAKKQYVTVTGEGLTIHGWKH
eukprot:2107568-Amphidinium_carterae.1